MDGLWFRLLSRGVVVLFSLVFVVFIAVRGCSIFSVLFCLFSSFFFFFGLGLLVYDLLFGLIWLISYELALFLFPFLWLGLVWLGFVYKSID